MRIQGDSCFHFLGPDGLKSSVKVSARLIMHGQYVGSQIMKCINVPIGIDNHQVHIQWLFGVFGNGFHHRHTKTDVGNEHAVHDIQMKPIRLRRVDDLYITLQIGKICRQNRRC